MLFFFVAYLPELLTDPKKLDNRSKQFANTTQTSLDERGFQKLEKSYMYSDKLTNQFRLKKSYVTGLFLQRFIFFH